ncbi:hypothetical protein YWIDRAFT_03474 [Streptomyces sp. SceaMP-e96]|uniref:hypothetical protein n=1 Tax=unclassified Streptomyces TaxID=2593676 RepID=UPI000823869C|nr:MULTISPECIES: hypothetical protein [unclassified Streptomyces]MYT14099.1 hypothetical protein [Streptomyces sp. SID4951]SCK58010.1 hypothetical protein YWIDRAFT_03474 [Streptomyces sp. SceaMP-e96]
MHDAAHRGQSRPFTLVACTSCRDAVDSQVMDRLRHAVRSCDHGVMVATGCLGRLLDCHSSSGLYAAVQPCAADRRPTGTPALLGPIVTEADAESIGAWLLAGMPDDDMPRIGLRAAPAPRRRPHLN